MKRFEPVPMPTEAEKRKAVGEILAAAMPEEAGFRGTFAGLRRCLGLRELFFGVGDCVLLSGLTAGVCFLPLLLLAFQGWEALYALLFLASPALYGMLHLLTGWKELQDGTWQWKASCRISLRQLTALRMLVCGGGCLAVSAALSIGIWMAAGRRLSLLRLLGVSSAALVLFAAALLGVQLFIRRPGAALAVPAVWMALGGALLVLGERLLPFWNALPTGVLLAGAVLGAVLYGFEWRHWFTKPQEGVLLYAAG